MDDRLRRFLEVNHAAIMATIKDDGRPHLVRCGVGLVEGKLWSSGTQTRVRTGYLRRDPRATLLVMSDNPWRWAVIESRVTILEGEDAPEKNLALYRVLAGEPDDVDEYLEAMVRERRLIYEFSIDNTYGEY